MARETDLAVSEPELHAYCNAATLRFLSRKLKEPLNEEQGNLLMSTRTTRSPPGCVFPVDANVADP